MQGLLLKNSLPHTGFGDKVLLNERSKEVDLGDEIEGSVSEMLVLRHF